MNGKRRDGPDVVEYRSGRGWWMSVLMFLLLLLMNRPGVVNASSRMDGANVGEMNSQRPCVTFVSVLFCCCLDCSCRCCSSGTLGGFGRLVGEGMTWWRL